MADEDKNQEEESGRPPMDLFKAIFVSSSDEKSSSSEEESDEEQQPTTSERASETPKQVEVPDSSSSNIQGRNIFMDVHFYAT